MIGHDFLQQVLLCCCPDMPLIPAENALPLLASGIKKTHRPCTLFTPKLTLWNTKNRNFCYIFHVDELNFDTLAQCHTCALEAGLPHFNPATKHSHTCITAVILCDHAQTDAMEALVSFKQRAGSPFSFGARLSYRLAAIDLSAAEVSCNRCGYGLKAALQVLADTFEH